MVWSSKVPVGFWGYPPGPADRILKAAVFPAFMLDHVPRKTRMAVIDGIANACHSFASHLDGHQ